VAQTSSFGASELKAHLASIHVRREALTIRVGVGDRAPRGAVIRVRVWDPYRRLVAARRQKQGAAGFGGSAGTGGEQPRQRRDALALPDGAGSASETGRWTRGTSAVRPLKTSASSNPVDVGWIAVRTARRGRELPGWIDLAGREATVKDCGVAVAMPQGQSWPPHPASGSQ
jgi:hypothetical protein